MEASGARVVALCNMFMGSTQVIAKMGEKNNNNKDQANTGSYMTTFPGEC